jgi:predicted RNA-binding Zn ribbon-like protein
VTQPSKSETAPGDLELVRRFVNTRDIEEGTEKLDTPASLELWLAAEGLGSVTASADDLTRFTDAREGLRALMLENNGRPRDEKAVSRLDAVAAEVPLRVSFAAEGAVEPSGEDAKRALGAILAAAHAAMRDGRWERMKACRAEDCEWAFYDASRNRSGTWCSMEVCGNRAKARAFRARHRHPPGRG